MMDLSASRQPENAMMIAVVARARGAGERGEERESLPSCCDELRRHDLPTYHGRIDTPRWHVRGLFRQFYGSMQNTTRERARTARCMNTVMQLATKAASGGKRSIGTRSLFSQCSLVFSLHACLVCLSLIGISAVLNYEGCTRQRRSPIHCTRGSDPLLCVGTDCAPSSSQTYTTPGCG